jgi:fermentation-respiration switch protein FrsA (DUF1100 family)
VVEFVIRVTVVSYGVLLGLLYFGQAWFVYPAGRDMEGTPRDDGLAYEDVSLTTSDGVKLSAWFVPVQDARGTAIFCHGNGGNISHRLDSISILHELGLSVLIFDYRGYGKSEGKPTEDGTYLDAEAAWKHVVETRGVAPERIVIFGESLGGSVATHLARDHTPGALVLVSTFASLPDVGAERFWFLPVRLLCRYKYPTIEFIRGVKCPVLVGHSRDDELVRFHQGEELFAAAAEPKQFVPIRGSHNDGFIESHGLRPYLGDFLRKHLPARVSAESGPSK